MQTNQELYGPGMVVEDQAAADQYFADLVEKLAASGHVRKDDAEHLARVNLGYYAGYHSHETRQRVERLFGAVHPILGVAGDTPPSAEVCIQAGLIAARKLSG